MSLTEFINTSGTHRILLPRRGSTPLVQLRGSSFQGSVYPYVNTGNASNGQTLTATGFWVQGNPAPYPAGSQIAADGNYELDTRSLETWLVVVVQSGSFTLTILPDYVRPVDPPIIPLANVSLDVIPLYYPEELAFLFQLADDQEGATALTATPTSI